MLGDANEILQGQCATVTGSGETPETPVKLSKRYSFLKLQDSLLAGFFEQAEDTPNSGFGAVERFVTLVQKN